MKARVSYEGESMKKVFVDRYGAPDVLTVRDVAMPEPRRDEVRIRVGASGVNFADLLMRAGVVPAEVCERCNDIWATRGAAA